jgi:glycosyltransferase involved in cell wall biosynthesis
MAQHSNSAAALPLVSVVVTTYNRARLLPRAVESVLRQTYEAVEIVIVDDGSTDETPALLESLAAEHGDRLRYVTQKNAGCAAATNRGIEIAHGELIAFVDSDDEWTPAAAETLVSALLAAPEAALAYSPAIEVFADGTEWLFEPVAANSPESFATAHFMNTNLRCGAFLVRRDALHEVGCFDEGLRHNEDSDLVQRIAIVHPVTYSPVPTLRVHHHGENKSRDRVAITAALIASSTAVLRDNPRFAERLGEAGQERLYQLKVDHVTALAHAARYRDAAEFARKERLRVPLPLRLALIGHSLLPLRLETAGRRRVQSLRSRRK